MNSLKKSILLSLANGVAAVSIVVASSIASANGHSPYAPVTVYVTRHAEKQTEMMELDVAGKFMEICGETKCAEELNAQGKLRAKLLASWFKERGITNNLTHVFSSHKQRTLQTIEPTVADALAAGVNLAADHDLMTGDGIQQIPADGMELAPESTKPSIDPTVGALTSLPGGSTVLLAGHSGSIYKIMEGLGIDTSSSTRFPRDAAGKVRDFGDVWKMVIYANGNAQVHWKVNLQPVRMQGTWQ